MKPDNITIGPALKSDTDFLAATVMGALGDELCIGLAGSKQNLPVVHKLFKRLAEAEDSQYSYTNAGIARVDGQRAGAIIAYDGARLHELRKAFVRAANDLLGWHITDEEFNRRGDETEAGETYIDSLYVAPEYRGKGIASALIAYTIETNTSPSNPTVGLLVEFENRRAQRLYETLGFKTVGVNNFFPVPMHHMQKTINFSRKNFAT